ncbi:MAG: hypothetical protein WD669_06490 [Pirellulales bacterium]
MRPKCCRMAGLIIILAGLGAASPAQAQRWKWFVPTQRVEADPQGDYALKENHGPWLIVAATFSGDGAEPQAQRLALELRERYNLTAYLHKMAFDYSDESPAGGTSGFGTPARRRYRREGDLQYAVLVGDFPRIDDPDAQQILERVKRMQPAALHVEEGGQTAQSLVQVRAFQDAIMAKLGVDRKRGPMGQAFIARNPLLPREYFVPKGVDEFVAKMNDGVKYGLLDCPGKYSVRVGTFRGRTILQTSGIEGLSPAAKSRRAKDNDDALVEAAENAHLLTEELRAHGWEAYEFHDRTESIVTIGSFNEVAQKLPDGRLMATPAVQRIMETFGAAYNTPADPLSDIGNDAGSQRRVDQKEQEVNALIGRQQGQTVPGLNPKHVNILRRKGGKLRTERLIPIDIYPQAIEAPKRSISSAYVR